MPSQEESEGIICGAQLAAAPSA